MPNTEQLPPLMQRPTLGQYMKRLAAMGRLTPIVEEACQKAEQVQDSNATIIYVAGALTGVSEEMKQRYAQIKDLVEKRAGRFAYVPHLNGTDPVRHPRVSPGEVRDIDFLFSTVVADYQINCWFPVAHGNAIEEAWGEGAGIPALYIVPQDLLLSRLPRGMWNIVGTVAYTNFEIEALPQIGEWLDSLG